MQRLIGLWILAGIAIVFSAEAACADTIIANTFWNSGNYAREYSDGTTWAPDNTWTVADGVQGYKEHLWLNIGTSWETSIPDNQKIVSATLTFAAANSEAFSAADCGIFEVPDANYGNTTLGLTVGNSAANYQSLTCYGVLSASQISAGSVASPHAVTTDITNLIKGWKDHTLTTNPGQMMILGDSDSFKVNFGVESGFADAPASGPTIMIETAPVPEPSALVLLATALIGLLAYAWRKRK